MHRSSEGKEGRRYEKAEGKRKGRWAFCQVVARYT